VTLDLRPAHDDERAAWDAFVAAREEGDVLQSWAWGEVGRRQPGERWARLVLVDQAGRWRGVAQVLARRTTFGRSILYVPHGPLWERDAPDSGEVLATLLDGLREHARAERGVLLKLDPRSRPPGMPDGSLDESERLTRSLLRAGLVRSRHDLQAPTTRLLDLTGDEGARRARWTPDARAEWRRALREATAVEVDRVADPRVIDAFHGLWAETSVRAGFRIRPRAFLTELAAETAPRDGWFMALARADGRAVAGATAIRVGDRAFYLYAASTRDRELIVRRGPYAAMAGLVDVLAEAGVRTLDLWGVRERDDPTVDASWEGFSLFKRRFGGVALRHPGTFDLVISPAWHRLRDLRERVRGPGR
jgi:lipid II:glycine glycyltransferase (peptidoglycan interpeptide bridge formation enzyme)